MRTMPPPGLGAYDKRRHGRSLPDSLGPEWSQRYFVAAPHLGFSRYRVLAKRSTLGGGETPLGSRARRASRRAVPPRKFRLDPSALMLTRVWRNETLWTRKMKKQRTLRI